MSKMNETPEMTDDSTTPKKRISLRREKVRSLNVRSGVQTGGKVGPGPRCPGLSLISCEISSPD